MAGNNVAFALGLAQKAGKIGAHDRLFVRFLQYVCKFSEPSAPCKDLAQQGEFFRFFRQQLVEGKGHGAGFQLFRFRLVGDAEIAVDIRLVKIAADDVGAEGVQSADIRRADLRKLGLEPRAHSRVLHFPDAGEDGRAEPLLHLRGGGLGEGDREDGGYVCPAREDEGDDLFDHDECFSAAGGCGNEHLPRRVDGGLLFRRGSARAHRSPLLFLTMFTISSPVTFFSERGGAEISCPHMPP